MNKLKLNNSNSYEGLYVTLDKRQTPIAFEAKVNELVNTGEWTRKEAEEYVSWNPILMELYYETGTGLFAVESAAVESGTIYSPYTKQLLEPADE
ncbi:hypothetical protein [Parabacteroides merdae]|jgi:hypothetical protein|uniref:hypothetical protein n=1 Tax=Parabacteroides merdae TaxID=46503 RepID=UPI0034A2E158